MAKKALIRKTTRGLFCEVGQFYIDPWRPVKQAVVTHAHADHARQGCELYFAARSGEEVLRSRLGQRMTLKAFSYHESFNLNGVKLSFHPAGHILGSSQVRVEYEGEVWVVTGDYKRQEDPTCEAFQVVECDTLITEATFGLPLYQWQPQEDVAKEILHWWDLNAKENQNSVIFAYSLGKAQRLLSLIFSLRPEVENIFVHDSIDTLNKVYAEAGVSLPFCQKLASQNEKPIRGALIICPPSAERATWLSRIGPHQRAMASGWMQLRGRRRFRGLDQGFVLSDHADWNELIRTVKESRAKKVLVTHGYNNSLARYLVERENLEAHPLKTDFGDEPE